MDIEKNKIDSILSPTEECSFWTKILIDLNIYDKKDCKPITNFDKYNKDLFLKSFAFWKIFLIILFLLAIGIINLVSKYDETRSYMYDKKKQFFIEFLLLFGAFFVSTLIMYFMRLGQKIVLRQLGVVSYVIFVFCICKHFAFELSGIYRWKFGSDVCNEERKKDEHKHTVHFESQRCNNCDNGFFTGLFWDGLGKYGIGLTIILLIFFGTSLLNPKYTKHFFNYEFTSKLSSSVLVCILVVFVFGFFLEKILKTGIKECQEKKCQKKECKVKECNKEEIIKCKKKLDMFTRIKNGCALVSIVFMTIITLVLPYILFLWLNSKTIGIDTKILVKDKTTTGKYYNCNYKNEPYRFILILIESLIIYLIFSFAEAGIEYLRKNKRFIDIIKNTHFWIKTLPSLLGILAIQILLEYTDWYEYNLFTEEQLNEVSCSKTVPVSPVSPALPASL